MSALLENIFTPTVIPQRIYRFSSDHRSQAPLGPVSTRMGDRLGITGAVGKQHFRFFLIPYNKLFILYQRYWRISLRQRSYHREYTGSRPITEVKLRWARLVLGWVTAWE